MTISGIEIIVQKKKIKNAYITVKPPIGEVYITAPLNMSDNMISMYAHLKMPWIKKQIEVFKNQDRQTKRQYVSGEAVYIFGAKYMFLFIPDNTHNHYEMKGDKFYLYMRENSTTEQRANYMKSVYRELLKEKLMILVPNWEKKTDLKCDKWIIRYMKTHWGSCKKSEKTIYFNLQLVHKPVSCIEYIVLHELVHLKYKNHKDDFWSEINKYMPNWEREKEELNNLILDYY